MILVMVIIKIYGYRNPGNKRVLV